MIRPLLFAAVSAVVLVQGAPIKGAAVLKHPLGVLGTRVVDLIAAGKIDEVMAIRTKSDQADWKKASAAEKKDFADRMKQRAPTPAQYAELVKAAGELTIDGDIAMLVAETPAGMLRQTFEREGGQWRASFGPIFMAAEGAAPKESRVTGAALRTHPAIEVVLQYADFVQAGQIDQALAKLGSTQAQAKWKALPASEKKESLAFRKNITPTRSEITTSLDAGGVLIIAGDKATLNVIKLTTSAGRSSSTTTAIPLTLESGQWKIAQ